MLRDGTIQSKSIIAGWKPTAFIESCRRAHCIYLRDLFSLSAQKTQDLLRLLMWRVFLPILPLAGRVLWFRRHLEVLASGEKFILVISIYIIDVDSASNSKLRLRLDPITVPYVSLASTIRPVRPRGRRRRSVYRYGEWRFLLSRNYNTNCLNRQV